MTWPGRPDPFKPNCQGPDSLTHADDDCHLQYIRGGTSYDDAPDPRLLCGGKERPELTDPLAGLLGGPGHDLAGRPGSGQRLGQHLGELARPGAVHCGSWRGYGRRSDSVAGRSGCSPGCGGRHHRLAVRRRCVSRCVRVGQHADRRSDRRICPGGGRPGPCVVIGRCGVRNRNLADSNGVGQRSAVSDPAGHGGTHERQRSGALGWRKWRKLWHG